MAVNMIAITDVIYWRDGCVVFAASMTMNYVGYCVLSAVAISKLTLKW